MYAIMRQSVLVVAFLACVGSARRLPTSAVRVQRSANCTLKELRATAALLLGLTQEEAAFNPATDAGIFKAVSNGRNLAPSMQISKMYEERERKGYYEKAPGVLVREPMRVGETKKTRHGMEYRMHPKQKRELGLYGVSGKRRFEELRPVKHWFMEKFGYDKHWAARSTTSLDIHNRRSAQKFLDQADDAVEVARYLLTISLEDLGWWVARAPQVLNMTAETEAKLQGWKDLGLTDVLKARPALFHYDFEKEVAPMARLLLDMVGLKQHQMQKIIRFRPNVVSMFETAEPMIVCLKKVFAFTDDEVKEIVKTRPQILGLDIEEDVKPQVAAVSRLLDLTDKEVRQLVLNYPAVLELEEEGSDEDASAGMDTLLQELNTTFRGNFTKARELVLKENSVLGLHGIANVKTMGWVLRAKLFLTDDEAQNAILRAPKILSLNFSQQIEPLKRELRAELEISSTEDVSKLVARHPEVLTYNFEQRVTPVMDVLRELLDFNTKELRKVVLSEPYILSHAVARNGGVRAIVIRLQELLGLSTKQMHHLALKEPSILTLDILLEMEPRIKYLQSELKLSQEQLRSAIIVAPKVLSKSLESTQALMKIWKQEVARDGLNLQAETLAAGLGVLTRDLNQIEYQLRWAREQGVAGSAVFKIKLYSKKDFHDWLEQQK